MRKYAFSENNSGGSFWLNRAQYEKLFANGWRYQKSEYKGFIDDDKPFGGRGDDVPYGWRHNLVGEFPSIRAAVESFETATGEDFFAQGCNCCGCPFHISSSDDGEYESVSGDSVDRTVVRPW